MSKYTTEVRYICEHYAGLNESTGFEDVDEIVEKARHKIFLNYPIFDENHRAVRFCTSWATKQENVDALCIALEKILG